MIELDEVLAALEASAAADVALATVVAVRGSTYRREGARLFIGPDRETVGNISGGCLEGDVVEAAADVLANDEARLLRFDLAADNDVWGWGLGCTGEVDVLIEPGSRARPVAAALRAARDERRAVALVTVVEGPAIGAHLVVHPHGQTEGALGEPARKLGLDALATGRSSTATVPPGGERAFVEVFEPPMRLVVCGAGPDAVPLVALAATLGWRVDVVDHRRTLLTAERFPAADGLIHVSADAAAPTVDADGRTAVVVMSHNLRLDTAYLRSFVASPVAYIGLLGPAARRDVLIQSLDSPIGEEWRGGLQRVHGPAGLDLAAEEPAEIATAIVAEILAATRGAPGGFLRDRSGPIHRRARGVGLG